MILPPQPVKWSMINAVLVIEVILCDIQEEQSILKNYKKIFLLFII